MSGDASIELRRFAGRVVDAFIQAVDRQYGGSAAGPDMLRNTAAAFSLSPLLVSMAEAAACHLLSDDLDDPYQRLLVSPLDELLQSGELNRDILPNYFNFLHLVMGDGKDPLAEACAAIVAKMKAEPFPPFGWDDFLADPRVRVVLWTVLLRIAESFRRFDARRDWFIKLMQYDRQSVSLAANAFLPKNKTEDEPVRPPFGPDQFNLLFAALFGPLRRLSDGDKAAFKNAFGQTVEVAFGPIWQSLKAGGAKL